MARVSVQMKREINPKAQQYFPSDVITVVFDPYYSCPKAPDIYKLWISDYRELLIAKGYREHEHDGSWEGAPTSFCTFALYFSDV